MRLQVFGPRYRHPTDVRPSTTDPPCGHSLPTPTDVARYRDSSKDVLMPPSYKLHAVTAHALLEAFTRGTPVKVVEGAVGEVLADYLAT